MTQFAVYVAKRGWIVRLVVECLGICPNMYENISLNKSSQCSFHLAKMSSCSVSVSHFAFFMKIRPEENG